VIVTGAPTAPELGDTLVMAGTTAKFTPLLLTPLAFTTTFPVLAPVGTAATIDVAPQLMIVVAVVPLNVTVFVPWVEPKPVPAIVTNVPTVPDAGDRLVMVGTTVKFTPLLTTPPMVITMFPVVAPAGTGTMIDPVLQPVGVAAVPLNVTVLVPCIAPKFVPVIATEAPTAPDVADKLVIFGAGNTVVLGTYNSTLDSVVPLAIPPAKSTLPFDSAVPLCPERAAVMA